MTDRRLTDPETREPLVLADARALERLVALVREGRARQADGKPVAPFDGAFLPPGRRHAYPIRDGIPNFLLEERLEVPEALP